LVAATYVVVQLVIALVLDRSPSQRPVAEAAQMMVGPAGAIFVSVGALVATTGHIVGSMLAGSRITFAMAERGSVPRALSHVHPIFQSPAVSILAFGVGVWALAISGSFVWNAYLSAVARLLVYGSTSLAVLRLRRSGASSFVAPTAAHYASIAFCLWLLTNQTRQEAVAVAVVVALGSLLWCASRFKRLFWSAP
jgi:amino acid transporter